MLEARLFRLAVFSLPILPCHDHFHGISPSPPSGVDSWQACCYLLIGSERAFQGGNPWVVAAREKLSRPKLTPTFSSRQISKTLAGIPEIQNEIQPAKFGRKTNVCPTQKSDGCSGLN